jgi:hypothetical protein
MRKRLLLFFAIILFSLICFAQDVTTPPSGTERSVATTTNRQIKTDAELPQTASPLPLTGILAVGFLCAGYMTLRAS